MAGVTCLGAGHYLPGTCRWSFLLDILFGLHSNPVTWVLLFLHFTEEETGAQRGQVTCTRSHSHQECECLWLALCLFDLPHSAWCVWQPRGQRGERKQVGGRAAGCDPGWRRGGCPPGSPLICRVPSPPLWVARCKGTRHPSLVMAGQSVWRGPGAGAWALPRIAVGP